MPSHVTKRECGAVAEFAAQVLSALNMPAWQILVMEEPADEDDFASISKIDGKHVAQIYLSTDWMKRTDEERRETITHEVLHLLHFRIDHVLDDAKPLMREHEHDMLMTRYWREAELMVDHLARWLSRTHSLEQAWDTAHGR